ncbi:MAG: hypothetical protein U1E53_15970 [Dongiaceae bacterium]
MVTSSLPPDEKTARPLSSLIRAISAATSSRAGGAGRGGRARARLPVALAAALPARPSAVLDALLAGEAVGAGLVCVDPGLVGGDRRGGLAERLPDAALDDQGVGLGVVVGGGGDGLLGVGQRGLEVAGRRGAALHAGAGQADLCPSHVGGGAGASAMARLASS